MPLIKSKSKKAFKHNVEAEIHAGKPPRQAVAIAYSEKRQAKKASGGEVEKPPIESRSMYAKSLAKHLKTKESYKNEANEKAYKDVEKKHGRETLGKLKKWHEANERGDIDGLKHGGNVTTHEPNSKHKGCW
jgi:hypothetical protein